MALLAAVGLAHCGANLLAADAILKNFCACGVLNLHVYNTSQIGILNFRGFFYAKIIFGKCASLTDLKIVISNKINIV